MKYLYGREERKALTFIDKAAEIAKNSECDRSRCGSVIVKDEEIIGKGFNSPPAEKYSQKRCHIKKCEIHPKVTDKTCCIHAEQRAIMDSLKNSANKIKGSTLYFIRLNFDGKKQLAEKPYCTICSKMALDIGIKNFVLLHEKGVCVYNTKEYNDISFRYGN